MKIESHGIPSWRVLSRKSNKILETERIGSLNVLETIVVRFGCKLIYTMWQESLCVQKCMWNLTDKWFASIKDMLFPSAHSFSPLEVRDEESRYVKRGRDKNKDK